jgi:hypothetical protein
MVFDHPHPSHRRMAHIDQGVMLLRRDHAEHTQDQGLAAS